MKSIFALVRGAPRLQAVRFLLIGGFNTLFGYAFYLTGLGLKLTPEAALALATTVGAVFNYFTTARFVFGHRSISRLPLFIVTYAVIFFVNAGAILLLLRTGFAPALAQACLTPPVAALSFVLFRSLVFRSHRFL